jgi:hypothetical protein
VKPEDFWRTKKGAYSNAAIHHVSLENDDGCGYDVRDHCHPAASSASSAHLQMHTHARKDLVSDANAPAAQDRWDTPPNRPVLGVQGHATCSILNARPEALSDMPSPDSEPQDF